MASVKIRGLSAGTKKINNIVDKSTFNSMTKAMKDLERVASETAPLDEGDLEIGGFNGVDKQSSGVMGWVGFEAFNDHPNRSYDFNYAIWIHEQFYNLGKRSQQKGSGKGLSGKSYPVGRKYLSRPHEGEAKTYRDNMEKDLHRKLRR